jgi:hypothetical protein
MCQWVSLFGNEHVTNYIRIIGAGHLSYFAKKYGNLYRYSQQGWESLNQLLKHYYFNNTNHGGSKGNGGKDVDGDYKNTTIIGDHCRPLMKLCQRTIMWKLGLGDSYFLNKAKTPSVPVQIETNKHVLVASDNSVDSDTEESQAWNVI